MRNLKSESASTCLDHNNANFAVQAFRAKFIATSHKRTNEPVTNHSPYGYLIANNANNAPDWV
jgi:hypothetical protein